MTCTCNVCEAILALTASVPAPTPDVEPEAVSPPEREPDGSGGNNTPTPPSAASAPNNLRKVRIFRVESGDDGTFGVLTIDGKAFCLSCELPWRDNARNVSCIPAGVYRCEMINRVSNGQPAYWIKDVPGRTGVVIHVGNTIKDSHGCPLLGNQFGRVNGARGILNSRVTINAFHAELKNAPFELTIVNGY